MPEKIVARPLITITNIIWSFNFKTHLPQILLIKRASDPFKKSWALPETLLRSNESAEAACIRLIKDKIGVLIPDSATEQLATFTNPKRVTGKRALALAYMTFLPIMPGSHEVYKGCSTGFVGRPRATALDGNVLTVEVTLQTRNMYDRATWTSRVVTSTSADTLQPATFVGPRDDDDEHVQNPAWQRGGQPLPNRGRGQPARLPVQT